MLSNALNNKFKIDPEELKKMEAREIMVIFDLRKCNQFLTDARKKLEEIGDTLGAKLALYGGGAFVTACIGVGGKNKTVNLHSNHRWPTWSGLNPVSVV